MIRFISNGIKLLTIFSILFSLTAWADDGAGSGDSETSTTSTQWEQSLKKKYELNDEQIKALKDSGISQPQMAMVSGLAQKSGRSIDDILKMRTEGKMGWGRIAKELGVHPSELGHSVSGMKKKPVAHKQERMKQRQERHQKRKMERMERKRAKHKKRGGPHGH